MLPANPPRLHLVEHSAPQSPRFPALTLVVAGAAAIVFVGLALAIGEPRFVLMDRHAFLSVLGWRNPMLDYAFGALSWLGYDGVLLADLALGVWLAATRRTHACVFFSLCTIGSLACNQALKHLIDRARPSLGGLMPGLSPSFPSGHAMATATLACVLSLWAMQRPTLRWLVCLGWAMAILVGISRVYLGAHYPSDVLAGWAGGVVWVLGVSLVVRAAVGAQRHRDWVARPS